jgi:CheY-like chemotaxis protein
MGSEPEVLLIEDNPGDVELIHAGLASTGLFAARHWHVVPDGEQALDYLRQRDAYAAAPRPQLILLDLNLPGRDGREILAEIKGDAAIRDIPVIVLSSSDDARDVELSRALRAEAHIRKADNLPQLIEILNRIHRFCRDRLETPP